MYTHIDMHIYIEIFVPTSGASEFSELRSSYHNGDISNKISDSNQSSFCITRTPCESTLKDRRKCCVTEQPHSFMRALGLGKESQRSDDVPEPTKQSCQVVQAGGRWLARYSLVTKVSFQLSREEGSGLDTVDASRRMGLTYNGVTQDSQRIQIPNS